MTLMIQAMTNIKGNILFVLFFGIFINAFSTNYYVSTIGNDLNSGFTVSNAWLTIDKVRSFAWTTGFTAGDSIFFEGGKTFISSDGIYLQCDISNGTASNPIVFTSYGTGKSVLKAKACHMFQVWAPDNANVGLGLEISNLVIEGDSIPRSGPQSATGIFLWNSASIDLTHLLISDVEIRGFAGNGIETGRDLSKGRIKNIVIKNVVTHHNPGALGVSPHTGSGIIVGGADSALIEHCISHHNGIENNNSGGPIGIWFWDCTNSIIQYCESYENKTTNGDGGGFDLDGGCSNCVIQYCYSHDNDGAGFLFAQFAGANQYGPLIENTIRYNISENDGRKGDYCGIYFWGANSTDKVGQNYVYNNTVYMGGVPVSGTPACIGFLGSHMENIKIWNNIFMSADNLALINSSTAFAVGKVLLQNNVYYAKPSSNFTIKWSSTFHSLTAWRNNANGQEMNGSDTLGIQTDPMLHDPGNGKTINNTYALKTLQAYKLQSTSPLINSASDLKQPPFSLTNIGQFDFFNHIIPVGGKFDYGAFDTTVFIANSNYHNSEVNDLMVFPNPITSERILIHSIFEILSIAILNDEGQILATYSFDKLKNVDFTIKLSPGIYFLKAITTNGIITKKIIKL